MLITDFKITLNKLTGKYKVTYDTKHTINMEYNKEMTKLEIIELLAKYLGE